MNWSIVLGILGVVVSVVVGWLSYRFADRRSSNQKYRTAKSAVLQELSKSLGEDAIPTPAIIQATMRSVLREAGDPKIDIEVDEVLDDLMRQVTADPFLDGDRRRKLQTDIEQVRTEAQDVKVKVSMMRRMEEYRYTSMLPSFATFVGIITTIATAVAIIAFMLQRFAEESGPGSLEELFANALKQNGDPGIILAGIIVAIAIPVLLFLLTRIVLDQGGWAIISHALRSIFGRKK